MQIGVEIPALDIARRSDVAAQSGNAARHLIHFLDRRLIDFLLCVEAGSHCPLMEQVKKGAGFDQADGFGVRKQVQREFAWDTAIE